MTERQRVLEVEGGEISENWENGVAACLAKEPGERPENTAAFLGLLKGEEVKPPAVAGGHGEHGGRCLRIPFLLGRHLGDGDRIVS